MGKVKIRKLKKTDYSKGYCELLAQLTDVGNISKEKFEKTFNFLNSDIFVMEYNSKIIATGSIIIEQKFIHSCALYAHIEDIVVDKTYRGMGFGNLMMDRLIYFADKNNVSKISLNCRINNIKFYEKCGFKENEIQMVRINKLI